MAKLPRGRRPSGGIHTAGSRSAISTATAALDGHRFLDAPEFLSPDFLSLDFASA